MPSCFLMFLFWMFSRDPKPNKSQTKFILLPKMDPRWLFPSHNPRGMVPWLLSHSGQELNQSELLLFYFWPAPTSTGNKHWLFYFLSLSPVHCSSFIFPVMRSRHSISFYMFFNSFLADFHPIVSTYQC